MYIRKLLLCKWYVTGRILTSMRVTIWLDIRSTAHMLPTSSLSNIDYYEKIASEYDVILRFTEEVQ